MFVIVAILSMVLGLLALRTSWAQSVRSKPLVWGGWLLILTGLLLWAKVGGHDRGVALGIIVFSFLALLFVGYNAFLDKPLSGLKKTRATRAVPKGQTTTSFVTYLARVWAGLLFVPISGVLAFVVALGVHELMMLQGVHAANSLVTGLFLFPILWACFGAYVLISRRPWHKAAFFSVVSLLSASLLVAGN